jgi:non-ribosomal peptide synthetase component E (peptide arylation enzyme)
LLLELPQARGIAAALAAAAAEAPRRLALGAVEQQAQYKALMAAAAIQAASLLMEDLGAAQAAQAQQELPVLQTLRLARQAAMAFQVP